MRTAGRLLAAALIAIAALAAAPAAGAAPSQPVTVPVLKLTKAAHRCAPLPGRTVPACVAEIAARAQRAMRARRPVRRFWVATTAVRAGEVSPSSGPRYRKAPVLVARLIGRFPAGGPRGARYGPFSELRVAIDRATGRVRSWSFVPVGGSPGPPLSRLGRVRPF